MMRLRTRAALDETTYGQRGNVCVVVAHGTPCLGPVTHAGCCFGPVETPNAGAQVGLLRATGMAEARRPAGLPNV